MKTIHKLLLALILTAPSLIGRAGGESSALADSAYTHEHYAEAAVIYRQLVDSMGESAQL